MFREAIAEFGFDTYACGEIDTSDRTLSVFTIIDWPDSWRKFYVELGLITHDPIIDALDYRTAPFTWSELRKDRRFQQSGSEALRLAHEHGWREGLTVPIPRGGSRFGLVAMVGHAPVTSTRVRDRLSVLARCLVAHIRATGLAAFPLPPAGLTGRQLDCLRLVAEGCSDAQIAERLGIASGTAHDHVEAARLRLRAGTRAHAVARAASFGILAGA